jgi:hypothetical protein
MPITRRMLSKVPEVTLWFWIIKILCTTVGESFADWVATTVGLGLNTTAVIFTVGLVAVLAWQMSLSRYVPFVYWLTVVVLSITGTLYTDIARGFRSDSFSFTVRSDSLAHDHKHSSKNNQSHQPESNGDLDFFPITAFAYHFQPSSTISYDFHTGGLGGS